MAKLAHTHFDEKSINILKKKKAKPDEGKKCMCQIQKIREA